MRAPIVGVMGSGELAPDVICATAYKLGCQIAQHGWVLLTGGRNVGVMDAASRGALDAGGLTVGILPDAEARALSDSVIIPIFTDMGSGRNNINVLSSQVVVACGLGAGTTAEIALAIKAQKPVIMMGMDPLTVSFFQRLGPVMVAATVERAIDQIQSCLAKTND
ncbi:MAG: cytochrome [Cyanobacteria bacterium P01_D01_bin.44]